MILVDIKVPSMDTSYDIQLDEDAAIYNIIAEVRELICQKEHCLLTGNSEKLLLCLVRDKRILSINSTLRDNGVQTGDSLLLI